jgi:hypothetical protein
MLYKVRVDAQQHELLLTWNSLDRIAVWRLNPEKVLETLLYPEEVITGHTNRFIAHKRYNGHIIRAVYEYDNDLPVVITEYYPVAKRYLEGGKEFADKILP